MLIVLGCLGNDSFDTGCLIWFSCLLVLVVYLIWVDGLSLPAGLCLVLCCLALAVVCDSFSRLWLVLVICWWFMVYWFALL